MRGLLTGVKRIYRNSSITHKLFLAFSMTIIIPAIVVSFLFIRIQEIQLFKDAMTYSDNHVSQINERLRSRLKMIENLSTTVLTQKSFIDFIHSDMREDGLRLVKFKQNQFEQMHNMIRSNEMVGELSFYVDNPNVHEIWPEIYHYDKFWSQDYWMTLRQEGGAAYKTFASMNGEDVVSYYRLVRLQTERQRRPTIMEIRVPHTVLFSHLFEENIEESLSIVIDGTDATRYIYNPQHQFFNSAEKNLDDIIHSIHPQLDVLHQNSPMTAMVGNQTFYASYRYIPRLDAYVVDITSYHALMKGPRSWYLIVIATACCVLLLMLLFVSLTTKRIFRRLDSVLISMRKVRRGQLDAKITTVVEGHGKGDEIDEMAVSYNNMLDELQRLMTQVVDKQLVAKNAQLHSLHSQINSHFLYNALESIRMSAEIQNQSAIADSLVSLGSLMRYSMRWRGDTVALHEELTNIQSYIQFINFMEGGNFTLTIDIPQDMLHHAIPKMCLQPIIENVVQHGAPHGGKVHIQITANVQHNSLLLIEISDDGVGIEPQVLDDLRAILQDESDMPIATEQDGLGLENVHRRLQLHYGKSYGLSIDSVLGAYTKVSIRLSWENLNLGGW